MPFYFVQLAPYRYGGDPTRLAGIWEAQLATLCVPNTGMAVTVDIGNVRDIHPRNKQDVGKRLALWALAKDYGKSDLVYSGPLYKSMKADGSKICISFDHVGSGLVSRDGEPLSHFTIAGEDKNFVEAKAEIDGDTVVVCAESVAAPVAVRFGWHQEAEPNLSNKEGLPASPFRTDKW
ncbi:MAG: sialate O-acetylesterase, partial [Planctomycetes bacterium]|nr:sialate O-acetylesterase [Planctomycetota bacterium]